MSIEKINQAKSKIAATSAYKTITDFFDEGSFCEIDAFTKSGEGLAEAVAGFGTVEGMPVYAFAQNSDICGGAMSKAQAVKLKKLYSLALKTGAPIVGFYDSIGGRLQQATELLGGCGDVLNSAASLSGVVPQLSVVLGTCLGTSALNAVSADFVIMSEKAQLSLDVTGENADAKYNAEHGNAAIVAKDTAEAVEKAKQLVLYLPSNNLNLAPETFEEEPSGDCGCLVSKVVDGGSKVKLFDEYGANAKTRLAHIGGQVVGIVNTKGESLDCRSTSKIAKFVRFCDAFSIPVITFANCPGFESLASAAKLVSAYAEATTVKISVVTGKAIGSAYIALAGTGANADVVYALPNAVISPVNVEAAAFIMDADEMKVPVAEQKAVADKFAEENLSAFNAGQNGYVDGIVEEAELRNTLISALDMLSGKRVSTLAKKHSTI
ncbi:MAG: carboxyl transferase domain-containing protein [Clostridia bacterium]|nr:carboxyl transferase domain-containing protein [Clostridia bacterium]